MTSPYKALPNLRHSNVGASHAALPSLCCALPGAASPKTLRYCSWCLACCLQSSLPLQITVSSTLAGLAPSAHLVPHKCNWHMHKSLWPASMCPCPPVNHQLAGPWAPWVAFQSWGRCAKKKNIRMHVLCCNKAIGMSGMVSAWPCSPFLPKLQAHFGVCLQQKPRDCPAPLPNTGCSFSGARWSLHVAQRLSWTLCYHTESD